ncbi:XTP/dITP diphosphatase [Zongyangia hominis]|uniref:dITP/XTP pyrophosphatase n=1 Tax=Zongyangia hominis TaxID=2763677 RepID=A0A926EA75_9FIRM|nr:XTP/dITP diphosphatase [Zongyangia hominis]MBC8569260.1 XTP/dITP diphosphatase [Zongyangia hominis]
MKVVIATGNPGKLKEFKRILSPYGVEVLSQSQAGVQLDVEETGTTFEENALLKAQAVFAATGLPAIADDSGLVVDALDGAPGVYTARYAGEHATDDENIQKLLANMQGVGERSARFVSAICYVWGEEKSLTTRGECEGSIGFTKRGDGGFGYDPIFMVGEKSFAQLSAEEKDAISHRGKALRLFLEAFGRLMEEK